MFRSSQWNNRRRRLATNHLLVAMECMEKVDIASRTTISGADLLKTVRRDCPKVNQLIGLKQRQ